MIDDSCSNITYSSFNFMIQVAVPEKNLEDFLKTAAELQVFNHYIFIIILLFSVGMRNEDLRGKK